MLMCCPPQLAQLNGNALTDSERRLTALVHSPELHERGGQRSSHSASTAESYRRKQRERGAASTMAGSAAPGPAGGRGALARLCDSARAQGRGSQGGGPATAEVQGGTHLLIRGNALHALSVRMLLIAPHPDIGGACCGNSCLLCHACGRNGWLVIPEPSRSLLTHPPAPH